MSLTTNIEWATSTGNPWIGCTKVSAGCKNCYIVTTPFFRFHNLKHGDPRHRTSASYWQQPLRWNQESGRGVSPLAARPRIFPSLCDWLDDEVPIEWLADFLKLIYQTPNLDWLLLTKRPENWLPRLDAVARLWACDGSIYQRPEDYVYHELVCPWRAGVAPANVWVGTSVEDQENADKRIPGLLKIPAQIRFLSCEPLLGPIDLRLRSRVFHFPKHITASGRARFAWEHLPFHWAIIGGESGKAARENQIEWTRSLVQQCQAANVACFVKQMGSFPTIGAGAKAEWHTAAYHFVDNPACTDRLAVRLNDRKGGDPAEWPEDLRIREFPKVL